MAKATINVPGGIGPSIWEELEAQDWSPDAFDDFRWSTSGRFDFVYEGDENEQGGLDSNQVVTLNATLTAHDPRTAATNPDQDMRDQLVAYVQSMKDATDAERLVEVVSDRFDTFCDNFLEANVEGIAPTP